ncbi:MAG TPA: hypothetical protein VNO18_19830 [Xanthobacteraceae bacterium]|jgi:hypothetical protein|nr:hypothetical protein [Xanthobacteraceae bacterium]
MEVDRRIWNRLPDRLQRFCNHLRQNRDNAAATATSMPPTTLRQLYRSFDNIGISNNRCADRPAQEIAPTAAI